MMKFRIKIGSETHSLQFDQLTDASTVKDLKKSLEKHVRRVDFQLSLNGKDPLDETQSIAQSGLVNGDRIHLLLPGAADEKATKDLIDRPLTLDDVTDAQIYPLFFDRLMEINQPKEDFDYLVFIFHALMLEYGFHMDAATDQRLIDSKKSSTFYVIRYRHKLADEERYRCSLAIMKTEKVITIDGVVSLISQACGKLSLNIDHYLRPADPLKIRRYPYQQLRQLSCLFKDHIAHRLLCKLLEESGRRSTATLIGLPDELKLRVAKNLSIRDFLNLQSTCRDIHKTLDDNLLWQYLCQRDFDANSIDAMDSSSEPKDWLKLYRSLYVQKQRQQTKSSHPPFVAPPLFPYVPNPHRIVFPDPNNVLPPGFHPYAPPIFRPVPAPGIFPSTTVIPFPPGFHSVWLG